MKGVDQVFHLAALIAIPFSYHSPDSYVDTNIKGTLNVLQAARDLGTDKIMVTSTSEVYEPHSMFRLMRSIHSRAVAVFRNENWGRPSGRELLPQLQSSGCNCPAV